VLFNHEPQEVEIKEKLFKKYTSTTLCFSPSAITKDLEQLRKYSREENQQHEINFPPIDKFSTPLRRLRNKNQ